MKSLHDQIADKCIHFTGLMSKTCKAGINYEDVKVKDARPLQLPCIKQGGQCPKCQFLTEEEIEKELKEIDAFGSAALVGMLKVKEQFQKDKLQTGKVKCECGGDLHYAIAGNGHARAKCSNCEISFVE